MKSIVYFILGLMVISCQPGNDKNNAGSTNRDSLATSLMALDQSWSDLSLKEGFTKSSLQFAADNAIELSQGEMPVVGKDAIAAKLQTSPDSTYSLQWTVKRAGVAASGDIGYTYGSWDMMTKSTAGDDTMIFGVYITVWERQSDGTWKYILDGGVHTPEQVN